MPEFPALDFGWSVPQVTDYIASVIGWTFTVPYISVGITVVFGMFVIERIARIVWRVSTPAGQSPQEVQNK